MKKGLLALFTITCFFNSMNLMAKEEKSCKKDHFENHKNKLLKQSLFCEVYSLKNNTQTLPDFDTIDPIGSFRLPQIDVNPTSYTESFPYFPQALKYLKEDYGMVCDGWLNVPETGSYKFYVTSDDGVRVRINHKLLIDDAGLHAPKTDVMTKSLRKGLVPLHLEYFQGPRDLIALKMEWEKLSSVSCNPTTNLVLNGDFEKESNIIGLVNKLNLTGLSSWDIFASLPNWTLDSGAGIEVQKSGAYSVAKSGKYIIELDSNQTAKSTITDIALSQKIKLNTGAYVLSMKYMPRTTTPNDSVVQVMLNDKLLTTITSVDNTKWQDISIPVSIAKNDTYKLSFKEVGTPNGLGSLIDDIGLRKDCGERQVISKKHLMGLNNRLLEVNDAD